MKPKRFLSLWGFVFVGVLGVLFHFAYNWLGQIPILGLFFPINESIWEHLKLLFFPVVLWWFLEWAFSQKQSRFFAPRLWALSLSMAFIVVAFYTYSGIIGDHFSVVDIGIYFLANALYFLLARRFSRNKKESEGENILALILFLTLLFSLWVFTFFPPDLALFQSPE